jgi:hypothetical protein
LSQPPLATPSGPGSAPPGATPTSVHPPPSVRMSQKTRTPRSCASSVGKMVYTPSAPEVASAAEWLLHNPPDPSKAKTLWFYYGTYYYAQGMYQRGETYAAEAAERVAEVLLPMQEADGSWKPGAGSEINRIYRTAMAQLSLSVKYHFLPIYQR